MPRHVVIHKEIGETPLQALERYRAMSPALLSVSMTYAGRLDPMASGALLILIGDECKKKDSYLALDKEYEFEILLGCESDTGDILGLAERVEVKQSIDEKSIRTALAGLVGTLTLPYPAFSSKTVGGKPLFQHVLEDTLGGHELPEKTVRIHQLTFLGLREIESQTLCAEIEQRLSALVPDEASDNPYKDFRKPAVLARWREILASESTFQIARCRAIVSSGTYIRSLAPHIAKLLGTQGLAYSIHRTEVGRYVHIGGWGFWLRRYGRG